MRIPDAYFAGGLGHVVAQVQPGAVPDASGGYAIGAAARNLGNALTGVADEQIGELERLQKLKIDGEARSALFAHENTLGQVVDSIARDKALTPQEKRDRFAEQADKIRGSFMKSVPPEYQYRFAPAFDEQKLRAGNALDNHLRKELQSEVRASGMVAREQLLNSAKSLEQKLAIIRDPDAWDWEAEGLNDEQRTTEIARFAEQATGAEIDRRLNSDDPRQVLKDLRATTGEGGDYANYADLSPTSRQAYIRTARSMIERQDRDAEQAKKEGQRQRDALAKQMFTDYKTRREALLPVDPTFEAEMWKAVSGTGYEAEAREVRKKTGSLDYVTGKIKSDPLTYGAAQMGIEIPPLSVENPAGWPEQLAARRQVADAVRQTHGLSYTPLLTNSEAEAVAGMLKEQSPQAQVGLFSALARSTDGLTMQRMAEQFAASDPVTGTIAALVAERRPDAAVKVAEGRQLLQSNAVTYSKFATDDMRRQFADSMSGAMQGLPQAREGYFQAVRMAYTAMAAAVGLDPEKLDKDVFDKALQTVVGGAPVVINGKGVVLPEMVTEEQFLDNINRIDADRLQQAGGVFGYRDLTEAADDIKDDAELWEAGGGRYRFAVDGKFLLTADGSRPLELDLSGALPLMSAHGGGK